MGKDPKPPSKYHLALHTRSTQFQVSLGTWGHARVEQQELKKFMLGQIEAQRVPGFQQDWALWVTPTLGGRVTKEWGDSGGYWEEAGPDDDV